MKVKESGKMTKDHENSNANVDVSLLNQEINRLTRENAKLRAKLGFQNDYIRAKVNQMLTVMGTLPLGQEGLDDETLIELDPIGIICDSFRQILGHLHHTNAELLLANEKNIAILDAAGIGFMLLNKDRTIHSLNQKMKDFFFSERDDGDIIGKTCLELICGGNVPYELCQFNKAIATNKPVRFNNWENRGRSYEIIVTPIHDLDGMISNCLAVYLDVTERMLKEEALRESEERYRDLFENANDLIQSVAPDGRFIYVNRAWRKVLGYSEQEIENLRIFDIIDPSCHSHCSELFQRVMEGQEVSHVEVVFVSKDGRKITVEGSANCKFINGVPIATRSIFRDMSWHKLSEEALAAEKEQLAVTLRSIGDGVITTDTSGRVVLINKIAEQLTGWSQLEACGQPLEEVFHIISEKTGKRCENLAEKMLKTGTVISLDTHSTLIAKDGTVRVIADSGAPICNAENAVVGTVLVFRDISEQQVLETNLQRAEKLESLGVLAGGIAHDFNNMLTGIIGNISIAAMHANPGDLIHKRLEEAEKAAFRARDLTQQLLTFAKGGAPVKKTASIVEILTDSAGFALRGANVRCCFNIASSLWPVEMDAGQISQVIHNLVLNADQAMPDGGAIFIDAENLEKSDSDNLPLPHGNYIHISIRDTGKGISSEHLLRIFDPYFTTKKTGSGLGLATSYSVIKNHSGCITIDSIPGKGSTFHIFLPASPETNSLESPITQLVVDGTGHVLVMDDEEMIRDVAGIILGHLGYTASFAKNGEETITRYQTALANQRPFDAVIMDLTIPGGMGGKEAIKKLLEIDPHVKAFVSSGYSNDPIMSNYKAFGFKGVIVKPYIIEEISKSLYSVLSAPA
ncbi:MAG: PAS domain S-box protein [Desulfuromonadaceae bacterium]|nr:PAS domain S-box protein [Desulfuromonadaceae bacterium]